MRAVICAAGHGDRWDNHLGGPKQLVISIDGENLLTRTVRQLRERGVTDVVIVGLDERFRRDGARLDIPPRPHPTGCSMDKFFGTRHLWNPEGRTTLLWGDVWHTDEAMDQIVAHDRPGVHYFRRPGPSATTGHPRDESWAVTWLPDDAPIVLDVAQQVVDGWQAGRIKHVHIRAHYATLLGADPNDRAAVATTPGQTVIDDWTDDFDRPEELTRWAAFRARATEGVPGRVSVIFPWRPNGCPHRDAAWAWVQQRYAEAHPDWELVPASDERPDGQPFNRSLAVLHGMARSTGEILVVADTDIWSEHLVEAVEAIHAGADWVVPHDRYVRLNEAATAAVLDGDHPADHDRPDEWDEPPYRQIPGSFGVYRRDVAQQVPMDPRFSGWGGEENAWGWALDTLIGAPVRFDDAPVWHLWHPPQPRESRRVGNRANEALRRRYAVARNRPDLMGQLIAEARGEVPVRARGGGRRVVLVGGRTPSSHRGVVGATVTGDQHALGGARMPSNPFAARRRVVYIDRAGSAAASPGEGLGAVGADRDPAAVDGPAAGESAPEGGPLHYTDLHTAAITPDEVDGMVAAVIDAFAAVAGLERDDASSRVDAAILHGDTAQVTEVVPFDLDGKAAEVVSWAVGTANAATQKMADAVGVDAPEVAAAASDHALARLAVLHHELVRPPATPVDSDEPTNAERGAYGPVDVPDKAQDVIDWIQAGHDPQDQEARAWAAYEAESTRDGDPRKTVMAAIEAATGG